MSEEPRKEECSARWAHELLRPGKRPRQNFFMEYLAYEIAVALAIGVNATINYSMRVPVFSGIHRYLLGMAGIVALAHFGGQYKYDAAARREEALRSFLEQNEDAFVREDKKMASILYPWIPRR